MPADSVGYQGVVPTYDLVPPDPGQAVTDEFGGLVRRNYSQAHIAALETAMMVSLRASVARDQEVWRQKTKIKEIRVGKDDKDAIPYKWHGKKVTFGNETVRRTIREDGNIEIVVSVPMEVK